MLYYNVPCIPTIMYTAIKHAVTTLLIRQTISVNKSTKFIVRRSIDPMCLDSRDDSHL